MNFICNLYLLHHLFEKQRGLQKTSILKESWKHLYAFIMSVKGYMPNNSVPKTHEIMIFVFKQCQTRLSHMLVFIVLVLVHSSFVTTQL